MKKKRPIINHNTVYSRLRKPAPPADYMILSKKQKEESKRLRKNKLIEKINE